VNGCEGGACVGSVTCIDSDGGLDYYVRGTVGSFSDRCFNEYGEYCNAGSENCLQEFYCEGGSSRWEQFVCPNGCSNGACVQETAPSGRPLYALNCLYDCKDTYSCIGVDSNNVKINYSLKTNQNGVVEIGDRKVIVDRESIAGTNYYFGRVKFTSALAGSKGEQPIRFAYFDFYSPYFLATLAHQVVGINGK